MKYINPLWVTANGRVLRVGSMSTDHIYNCANAFYNGRIPEDYLGGRRMWIKIFLQTLRRRGDVFNSTCIRLMKKL